MGYTKVKGFCLANELTNKLKSQPILWFKKEKKNKPYIWGKGLFEKFQGLLQLKRKKKISGHIKSEQKGSEITFKRYSKDQEIH